MSKKTLNHANLAALGAETLASLLLEVSTGSADIKRRLRLELSHNLGPAELGHDVRKRLTSLRNSRSFVGWRKRKALIRDLETQLSMITDKIAPDDPTAAFDLLWQFIALAPSVFDRVDDSRGEVSAVFADALSRMGPISIAASPDPLTLADRVWTALQSNDDSEWDGIIPELAPALGSTGLDRINGHLMAFAAEPMAEDAAPHEAIAFLRQLRGGTDHAAARRARFVKAHLQEIAAIRGDTHAYIAQFSQEDLKRPDIAAEVALLLIEQDQPQDALELLEDTRATSRSYGQDDWDTAYIAVLTALGQQDEAQTHRWVTFAATLNPDHLRNYIKELPDFDDVVAEERAMVVVLEHPDAMHALRFLIEWPDLVTAAQLVRTRADEIDGDRYDLLVPTADALRDRHPLAAVLLWRAMINFSLFAGRSSRYGHAADHLADCAALDAEISDYAGFLSHDAYVARLRSTHAHKSSFWEKVL